MFLLLTAAIFLHLIKFGYTKENCTYFNKTISPEERCQNKFYYSFQVQGCKACTNCPNGFGISCLCGQYTNTKCKRCDKGTYSTLSAVGRTCMACNPCKKYERELHSCNATHDTKCVEIPKVPKPKEKNQSHHVYVAIVAVLVTLVVFSGLAIACVLKKLYKARNPHQGYSCNQDGRDGRDASLASEAVPGSSFSSLSDAAVRRFKNEFRSDTDSIQSSLISTSGSERPPTRTLKKSDVLLSSLTGQVFENLGHFLNPDLIRKDWKSLAGRLDFTSREIENMKINPRLDFTESLLLRYMAINPKATVGLLHQILVDMERQDAADVFVGFCNSEADKQRLDTQV